VFEEVKRKFPAWNTMVKLSTPYANPKCHNHFVTDSQKDRQTTVW